MATKKSLTAEQFAEILAAAGDEDRHAWSRACAALPSLNQDVVYRVLSAMGIVKSKEDVRQRNRESVKKWLTESGAKNTTPWKRQRTRKAVTT